jgi:predicted site-specific integrase-resolvase
MFESIKNAICSKDAPYMLKRAYIKVLFEAYINKKCDLITINGNEESNETIVSDEISEILSNEIIP